MTNGNFRNCRLALCRGDGGWEGRGRRGGKGKVRKSQVVRQMTT